MQPEELLGKTPDSFEVEFTGGRTALFANPRNIPFRIGDFAVVDVERGHDIGRIVREGSEVGEKVRSKGVQGPILRRATGKDIATMASLREREAEAHRTCQQCIAKQGLPMKLVDVEWQFDSNKIRFYFTSDRRVDFRKLVRDLASIFKSRIEMRQIGVRDEARRLGGYGRCGRYYCCRGVINDFDPVTLKMVKEQHLAPGSPKISGGCGRLMCCLRYERDFYKEASKEYPKLGTKIELGEDRGKGKVVAVDIFHGRVTLTDKEGTSTTVTLEDFKKGRITDIGDEEAPPVEDFWIDAEGETAVAEPDRPEPDEAPPAEASQEPEPRERPKEKEARKSRPAQPKPEREKPGQVEAHPAKGQQDQPQQAQAKPDRPKRSRGRRGRGRRGRGKQGGRKDGEKKNAG
jgi:cell fate regulator YaaT (PSP1 superfamily)